MLNKVKRLGKRIRIEIRFYQCLAQHPRTPRVSKWLLGAAVAYALSPIDLIPDFIPVLGHLDDLIILPVLVYLALKFIPWEITQECREKTMKA